MFAYNLYLRTLEEIYKQFSKTFNTSDSFVTSFQKKIKLHTKA